MVDFVQEETCKAYGAALHARIILLCRHAGITGSQLCQEIGISRSSLSDLKYGRKKGISVAMAKKIADYFGVSIAYLLSVYDAERRSDEKGGGCSTGGAPTNLEQPTAIPEQFEYLTPTFITVLDRFKHHYTGENMCRVRIEYGLLGDSGSAMAEYMVVKESQLFALRAKREYSDREGDC